MQYIETFLITPFFSETFVGEDCNNNKGEVNTIVLYAPKKD
jgi:hypothetical protein